MKNNFLIFSILSLFLSTVFLSCSDLEREKDTLELDKSSIMIDQEGGEHYIEVRANGEWRVKDIPEWLSVTPTSGELYGQVAVTATENKESSRRKASLVFMRGKLSETVEIEQFGMDDLLPFLTLSKESMIVGTTGGTEKIELTTNRPWRVEFAPDWITVTPSSGDKSTEITIRVTEENRRPETRNTIVIFTNDYVTKSIDVSQFGLGDVNRFPRLLISSYRRMEQTSGQYNVWLSSMFINPSIRDKAYLGNLVNHDFQTNTHFPEFTGYTFNPIRVSTSADVPEVTRTYVPSLKEQDEFAQEIAWQIAKNNPAQSGSFTFDRGDFEFYTYKQLQAVGVINLGIKLDEIISGHSFMEKEMTRKYGLVFAFKQQLFSLDMDINQKYVIEELKAADKAIGVSCVASVTYGKVGLLVVESDTDSRNVKTAINNVIAGKPLSSEETNLLSTVDVYYVYFDKDKNVQVKKGGLDAVNAYNDAIHKETDLVYPVDFELLDYMDYTQKNIMFSFKAGE